MIRGYLEYISKETHIHQSNDNFLLLGDFIYESTEEAMKSFCEIHNFKNLLDKTTCYKTRINPLCVNLIIKKPQKLPKISCVQKRARPFSQNDPNSTKIIFYKTETKSTKLPQR